MKTIKCLFGTLLVLTFQQLTAQNCGDVYYSAKEGTKLSYESYDGKNKLESSQEQKMISFKETATGFEAIMSVHMKDKKGKTVVENKEFKVKCDKGVFSMDLSSFYMGDMSSMKDMQVEVSGEGVSFPSSLEAGQDLPVGETEVKMKSNGMTLMTMRFSEINRKVEKKETVTTPAGTFECFKIISETEIKVMMKRTFKSASWIAKGIGIVKTESYNKKGELDSVMLLTKLEK